jgi:transcriptional regulator with XRE-family HTH domain
MKTMGEIISQKRKEKGMTQADLAAKMNVTDKAVSKWERGLSCPDVNSLSTLAEAFDMPVSELLNAKSNDAPQKEIQEIIALIMKAIPLAMGVAVTVLAIIGEIDTNSAFILLGIGLACLSIGALNEKKK